MTPLEKDMNKSLTSRQRDALRELKRGRTEAEIARRLGVTYNTVHTYVRKIYRHFGVHSKAKLLIRCFQSQRGRR